jgi:hypothetical protein
MKGETKAHAALKRLAFTWARTNGFPIAAFEVRVPASGYRADVAAASRHPSAATGAIALFECKQCRSDFLRDQADEPKIRVEGARIAQRVAALRSLIAVHRPDLRRGESLFAEYDCYDLAELRHETLHRLEAELVALQRKIIAAVKFSRLSKYGAADFLYLVTEPGIVEAHEIPNGWGLLVRDGMTLVSQQLPVRNVLTPERRLAWLEMLALAGTKAAARDVARPTEPPHSTGTPEAS